jgi:hypothetical protein
VSGVCLVEQCASSVTIFCDEYCYSQAAPTLACEQQGERKIRALGVALFKYSTTFSLLVLLYGGARTRAWDRL